jgi:hypothetical protein
MGKLANRASLFNNSVPSKHMEQVLNFLGTFLHCNNTKEKWFSLRKIEKKIETMNSCKIWSKNVKKKLKVIQMDNKHLGGGSDLKVFFSLFCTSSCFPNC